MKDLKVELKVKLLRRRILSGILAVVMMISSLQFSGTTVYAEEMSLSDVTGDTDSGEIVNIDEPTDAGKAADTAEPTDVGEAADTAESTDSEETVADVGQQTGDDIEEYGEVNRSDSDDPISEVKIELDNVYQFGGAPSGEALESDTPSYSVESDGVADDVNGVSIEDYMYDELVKRNPKIDVYSYGIEENDIYGIFSGVLNENPDLYFVSNKLSYSYRGTIVTSITPEYINNLDDDAFKRETRTALSVVKPGMSDLQKAIVLHDYLTVNCEYDYDRLNNGTIPKVSYSAYGVLVNRIAVCQGYALAYKYLLKQVGINSYMVISDPMNHAWNLIELDGKYYQVDVTWDDPTQDLIGRSHHAFMFCSDDVFKDASHRHHDWVVTFASNIVDYKATDTTYDAAFWANVNSPLVLTGDDWNDCYYTYYDAGSARIKKRDLSIINNTGNGDIGDSIYTIGVWNTWENNGRWPGAFSGLFQNNNRLYFNDTTTICSVNFDGTDKMTLFVADTSTGYIYGSAFCQGKVYYSLHQTPNLDKKETVLIADINLQEDIPVDVPVNSITLNRYTLTLEEGARATLKATVSPSYATNPAVTWSSSKESVATVNDGIVTAVGEGECIITAAAGDKKAECKVTVSKKVIPVTSISLNKSTLELKTGEKETLSATVSPDNATDKTVTWRSSKESVATVSNGEITAVGEGICTIIASAGDKNASCVVTVTKNVIPVTSISINKTELELKIEETETLSAAVLPDDATDKNVTWSSSDESVATVSNGTVTAVGAGECTITAAAGSKKAECKVTVIIPVENIILDRSSLELEEGEVITIQATVVPDNATDKTVTWSSSNDTIATVKDGEVTAIKKGECTITATAGGKSAVCNIVVSEFAPEDSIASGKYQKIRWFIDKEGKLTVKGSGNFAPASTSRKAPWYEHRNSIISAEINVTGMTDASYMFGECENLASIDMRRFDTSQVTNMSGMFIGCYGLTSINWGDFDTGKVTDMSWMFSQCINMVNLDLSSFDTSKVKNMANMFDSCSNLSSIDMSSFRTGNVTNMSFMFSGCLKLADLDLKNFDTSEVTNIKGMFSSCRELPELDLSSFDMTKVTMDDDNMLGGCSKLKTIHTPYNLSISVGLPLRTDEVWQQPDETEITELPTNLSESIIISRSKKEIIYDTDIASGRYENVTWVIDKDGKLTVNGTGDFAAPMNSDDYLGEGRAPWYQYRDLIVSAEVDITGMTDASYMFYDCDNLTTLSISGFSTSQITNMSSMFSGCSNLESLGLSDFDTSHVTDMNSMFKDCSSLESLDLSRFDTGHVTDMNSMFSGCSGLNSLNLSGFDTQLVIDMGAMFKDCSSLTTLNISDFNTGQVKDIAFMFNNCSSLTSLDLGNFDLNNVEGTKVSGVLAGCTSLASINVPLNLTHLVALPIESGYVWCQPNEEETTVLPINLSSNIEIQKKKIELIDPYITATKNKTSYECYDIINIDDLTVEYHDERGNVTPILDYSTNVADIDMTIAGTKTLVVTYRGLTYEIELTITKDPDDNQKPENTEGLKVELVEPNKTYTYTGYAITPKIKVTNNREPIYEGVDYTVKYTNNIKASDTAKIVVTGKGNLTGSAAKEFTIEAKWLDNRDVDADANDALPKIEGDYITVVEGSKASPTLLYGGRKLTSKEFKFADDKYKSYKWKTEDNNTKISIIGQGNFQGNKELTVRVIPKSEQKQYKLKVTLGDVKNITYNGKPQNIDNLITVSTTKMPTGLIPGEDYIISYPKDITNAGTKKVTVVGISDRCIGTVTKSYTIKPAKGGSLIVDGVKASYDFLSTGVTFGEEVTVKYKDAGNNFSEPLTEGVDYKITYSNNKKAGTAKYTVTGLGSYKGNKKTDSFNINPAVLCNNKDSDSGVTTNLKIVVADKVFKKPGAYKSAPYVSINGVLLKASNYKMEYYLDNPLENPNARVMDNKNNKVTNKNGDTTVWVKITGKDKGNYATTDSTCYAVASYKVRSMAESASSYDLSKAKISFQNKEGKTIKKVDFTGNPIDKDDIKVVVTYKIGRETTTLIEDRDYQVEFVNNVYKGKATVVITGRDDQTQYVGSKTATFSITANNIKNTLKWFGATS